MISVPKITHSINQSCVPFQITWRLDNESRVAGAISQPPPSGSNSTPSAGDVKPFDFDANSTDTFNLTNSLWDMM
jgi:hypothetical protein